MSLSSADASGTRDRASSACWRSWPYALAAAALALAAFLSLQVRTSWGWDETMHAELPAARILLHAGRGELGRAFDVLLACEEYPFVWPLALAVVQAVLGLGEGAARTTGWLVYALLLVLIAGLARRGTRGSPSVQETRASFFAFLIAVASPLLVAFAPTLFFELASAATVAAALGAWLWAWEVEREGSSPWRALLAGSAATLAFFTKFNYGLLLFAALGIDLACRLLPSTDRRRRLRLAAYASLVPALAALWWFVLPLPAGAWRAASHRRAFASWILGNFDQASAPWSTRLLNVAGYLCGSPLAALLILVGLLASYRLLRAPAVRTLWIALGCTLVPPLVHPFHLDRFLVPAAPALFALAALGWSALLARLRPALALGGFALALALAWVTAPAQSFQLARLLGLVPQDPSARAYVRSVLEGWSSPKLARRSVPTAGLARAEAEALLDALHAALGPEERAGWCGSAPELSPAALHLGLLERSGNEERFLDQAHRPVVLLNGPVDPGFGAERVLRWAEGFDAIVTTDPPDLKGRESQAFQRRFQRILVERGGYRPERVLALEISRAPKPPHELVVFLCRRE